MKTSSLDSAPPFSRVPASPEAIDAVVRDNGSEQCFYLRLACGKWRSMPAQYLLFNINSNKGGPHQDEYHRLQRTAIKKRAACTNGPSIIVAVQPPKRRRDHQNRPSPKEQSSRLLRSGRQPRSQLSRRYGHSHPNPGRNNRTRWRNIWSADPSKPCEKGDIHRPHGKSPPILPRKRMQILFLADF